MLFRRRKKIEKEKIREPIKEPEEKLVKEEREKEIEKKPSEIVTPKVQKESMAWKILKEPHITEKATTLAEKNQYIFKVFPRANKIEIKKAIENLYGVDVLGVKVIKVPAKKRRLGRIEGWRKGYKKAIIKIKEGQKIEVLPR